MEYDMIVKHLYLGDINAFRNPLTLVELEVKHVLSILEDAARLEYKKGITYMLIESQDRPKEDLLSNFEHTFNFVDNAIKKSENVYVHCRLGISRSATVIIAYLMKKYQLSKKEAYQRVARKRCQINPNNGFMNQLQLYQDMDYKLDVSHRAYRNYLLKNFLYKCKNASTIWPTLEIVSARLIANEFKQYFDRLDEPSLDKGDQFQCYYCHADLFSKINVIESKKLAQDEENEKEDEEEEDSYNGQRHFSSDPTKCKFIYIEPQEWIKLGSARSGELKCHECTNIIGSFNLNAFICDCKSHKYLDCLAFRVCQKCVVIKEKSLRLISLNN